MSDFACFVKKKGKTMDNIMIAPSIMCISEWQDTKEIFKQLEENGISMIHADVMDGRVCPQSDVGNGEHQASAGNDFHPSGHSHDGGEPGGKAGLV